MKTRALVMLAAVAACAPGHYTRLGDNGLHPFTLERYDFRLANGLRVLVEPDHRAPIVSVTTLVRAGAALDPAGKEGLAHLAARLTLRARGLGGHDRRDAYLVTASADASALADADQTLLEVTGASGRIEPLLTLHAAQLLRPLDGVTEGHLASERARLDREAQSRAEAGGAQDTLWQLRRLLFPPSDANSRPPEGRATTRAAITLPEVAAFAAKQYQPDRATLVLVGDFDPVAAQNLVVAAYGSPVAPETAAPTPPAETFLPPPPPPAPAQLPAVEADVVSPELLIGWALPGRFDRTSPPAELLASIARRALDRNAWPPLRDAALVEAGSVVRPGLMAPPAFVPERPLAPTGSRSMFSRSPQTAPSLADMNPAQMGRFIQSISQLPEPHVDSDITSMDVFVQEGVHASLLVCRIKLREAAHPAYTVENILNRLQALWNISSSNLRLNTWALAARVVLEAEPPPVRSRLVASYASFDGQGLAIARTIGRLDVRSSTVEHFSWDHLRRDSVRALLVLPRKGESPGNPPPLPPPATEDALAAGGAPVPVGTPPDRPALEPGRVHSSVLPNGIELVTVERHGIPVVSASAMLRVGTASGRPPGVVDALLRTARPGRRYGAPASFGLVEAVDARPDSITFEEYGGANNLGKMLAILSDRLSNVTVLGNDVEDFRKYTVPVWRRDESRPRARWDRTFWKGLFGSHMFGFRAIANDLAAVTLRDIQHWVAWTFRPENVLLVVAGDVDPAQAEQLARRWLGDWHNDSGIPEGEVRMVPERDPPPAANSVLVTQHPGSRTAEMRLGCLLPDSTQEADVVAYDLASELMARRVERQLHLGLAGEEVANESGRLLGGTNALVVGVTVDGSAATSAVRVLRSALDEFVAGTVPPAELDDARWSLARRHLLSFTSTRTTARAVAEARKRGLPLDWYQRYPGLIATTPVERIQATFKACAEHDVLALLMDEGVARSAALAWRGP